VLPGDVALARQLLGELLNLEQPIAEQCYEDGPFVAAGVPVVNP
jgi:hypothetical protein